MRQTFELDNPFKRFGANSSAAAGTALSALFSVICTFFTLASIFQYVPITPLLVWSGVICLIACARFYISIRHVKDSDAPVNLRLMYALTFAQGVAWGSAMYVLSPVESIYVAAVLTVIITGITVGGMLSQLATPQMWMMMFAPIIALHASYLFMSPHPGYFSLGALCVMFSTLFALSAVRLKKYLLENVEYQHSLQEKNEEILDKNDRLYKLAHYDGLTGAANRKLLIAHTNDYITSLQNSDKLCAFFHIDLDHFKHLNDTMGHAAGDELLRIVCARLQNCVREHDIVSRLGGDEFGVFVTELEDTAVAEAIAEKILNSLDRPQRVQGAMINCRASVGIAFYPRHGVTISDLMNNSDLALQAAKKLGRGNYYVCNDALQLDSVRKLTIETELRRALRKEIIGYHFQPIIRTSDGKITGAEALMRVESKEQLSANAEDLVQTATRVGLADELSLALFKSLEEQGPALFAALPDLQKISINLSPMELRSMKPVERLQEIFKRGYLSPEQVQIEITEQSILERGADQARKAIDQLSLMGLSIVMDDFGTGYSSLTHLKTLPISGVKIDKSFVSELVKDVRDAAIVRSLVGMCKGLGLKVTAEGVEEFAQYESLRRLGCDYVQGYLFFKAASVETLGEELANWATNKHNPLHEVLKKTAI